MWVGGSTVRLSRLEHGVCNLCLYILHDSLNIMLIYSYKVVLFADSVGGDFNGV